MDTLTGAYPENLNFIHICTFILSFLGVCMSEPRMGLLPQELETLKYCSLFFFFFCGVKADRAFGTFEESEHAQHTILENSLARSVFNHSLGF